MGTMPRMKANPSFVWIVTPLLAAACSAQVANAPRPETGAAQSPSSTMSVDEVAHSVQIQTKGDATIFRAPSLRASESLDLRRGGPLLGGNLGTVELARVGFLYGIEKQGVVTHYGSFQSDFVTGTDRFKSVALADGRSLPFRVVATNRGHCGADCYLIFESISVQIPEEALRSVPDSGLQLSITLDNGYVMPANAPAAYVRGYLQAVDSHRASAPQ